MIERTRFAGSALMITGLALAAVAVFSGCEKQPPAAQQSVPRVEQAPVPQHAPAGQAKATAAATEPTSAQAVAAEQTTCPVMGGAINKAVFVEYQGKTVYFCCGGCPDAFKANPQKYISKLPQFQN